ncbi:EG45-like domain containing protein 2 isoform X2 [Amborella trichopoda]|uniref:EG45-like domain containing protein 2 isoform X2 n=1 Tax=Amborella trichopoda TaxID=13333 RepID=UPI0009BE77DD|nr:EG45-like domain containing protein 2 isoform X2 [Amborella trichopoda]|eukprot:XP_020519421.1 EG45-like domain containing protein 2 isoform X2 [Amborella trichopoda]
MEFLVVSTVVGWLLLTADLAMGDVGTATSYNPPYVHNQFVAAGVEVWDNGAACGRKYRLRCLNGASRRVCKDGNIVVQVVDGCRGSPCPSTFQLSNDAFGAISHTPNAKINVEYVLI